MAGQNTPTQTAVVTSRSLLALKPSNGRVTTDRIDSSRMRRSCRRTQRAAFAQSREILRELLQHRENAPLIWTKMRQSSTRFSGSDASCRIPWSVGCITSTFESEFSAHTARSPASRPDGAPRGSPAGPREQDVHGVSQITVASTPVSGPTKLPGETSARPTLPAIGDLISV
jgi:hypothetical protein